MPDALLESGSTDIERKSETGGRCFDKPGITADEMRLAFGNWSCNSCHKRVRIRLPEKMAQMPRTLFELLAIEPREYSPTAKRTSV